MVEKEDPYLFIEAVETVRLPTCPINSLIPQALHRWRGWVTHAHIDENPGIRGHDLCFDKMCQGNRLTLCAGLVKGNGLNNH